MKGPWHLGNDSEYQRVTAEVDHDSRYLLKREQADMPEQDVLNRMFEEKAKARGIECSSTHAIGAKLIHEKDGKTYALSRDRIYAYAKPSELDATLDAFLECIVSKYGRGLIWTLAGRVHPIHDDGLVVCADIAGERHVAMRMFFVHDAMCSEVTLSEDRTKKV